jgi:hypothetical protein
MQQSVSVGEPSSVSVRACLQQMTRFVLLLAATVVWNAAAPSSAAAAATPPATPALKSFGTDRNLATFLAKVTEAQRRERLRAERAAERARRASDKAHQKNLARLVREQRRLRDRQKKAGDERFAAELTHLERQIALLRMMGSGNTLQTATGSVSSSPSPITNVQEAGVDEGGLVKRHGDHLVILRRGRLFTVAIGDDELRPAAMVDAFDPRVDTEQESTWYDELLVSGDTVVVVGFSYEHGGSEIGLFDIDAAGGLTHRATYHLRSSDYYTANNYSSRLIGTKLVFYTSSELTAEGPGPHGFPEIRKWTPGARDDEFQGIAASPRVYGPTQRIDLTGLILHTVTTCDLATRSFTCEATVVIGGQTAAFYVSRSSVYVWSVDSAWTPGESTGTLFRIPIDGAPPTALRVRGKPFDQFSFLESDRRFLNVVVARPYGDAYQDLDVSLLRIELERFADGGARALPSDYTPVDRCQSGAIVNRFVGQSLLVSCSREMKGTEDRAVSTMSIVRWATREVTRFDAPAWVSRIEPMGEHAIAVGPPGNTWTDLRFVTIRLDQATVADTFTFTGSSQRESRSHAFGYHALDGTDGIVGLPVVASGESAGNASTKAGGSIVFLRSQSLMLSDAGVLAAAARQAEDGCRASCVDWYGDARPLFIDGRVFALLGYEIVEGALAGGLVSERRRASFAPAVPNHSGQ